MKDGRNSDQISRLLEIAARHWARLPPHLARYLLIHVAMASHNRALPLLTAVADNASVEPSVREVARDYHQWVQELQTLKEQQ